MHAQKNISNILPRTQNFQRSPSFILQILKNSVNTDNINEAPHQAQHAILLCLHPFQTHRVNLAALFRLFYCQSLATNYAEIQFGVFFVLHVIVDNLICFHMAVGPLDNSNFFIN